MKLWGWMFVSAIMVFFAFLFTGFQIGVIIILTILLGIAFRCLSLLLDLNQRISQIKEASGKSTDSVKRAYEEYMEERNARLENK